MRLKMKRQNNSSSSQFVVIIFDKYIRKAQPQYLPQQYIDKIKLINANIRYIKHSNICLQNNPTRTMYRETLKRDCLALKQWCENANCFTTLIRLIQILPSQTTNDIS